MRAKRMRADTWWKEPSFYCPEDWETAPEDICQWEGCFSWGTLAVSAHQIL